MVGIDEGFFLQIPDESKHRILHGGTVKGITENLYSVTFEDGDLPIEDSQNVLIYYEKNRGFLQQPARIISTVDREPSLIVELEPIGEPISAESRQHYRISTVMAELTAEIGAETNCPFLDVSASGFSIICMEKYKLGNVVSATLQHQGQRYSGEVCVLSVRELSKGRMRYGLHCIESKKPGDSIQQGLQIMSITLQREQLNRMSGTNT